MPVKTPVVSSWPAERSIYQPSPRLEPISSPTRAPISARPTLMRKEAMIQVSTAGSSTRRTI